MKRIRLFDKPKNFRKTFWLYFFIITVIAVVASVFVYNTHSSTDEYEEYLDMTAELKKTRDEVDNTISIAEMLCRLILSYDTVKEYAGEHVGYQNTDFERVAEITRLTAEQESTFLSYQMEIALKHPDTDIVIGQHNTRSASDYLEQKGIDFEDIERRFEKNNVYGFYSEVINSPQAPYKLQFVAKNIYPDGGVLYLGVNFYVRDTQVYYDDNAGKIIVYRNTDSEVLRQITAKDTDMLAANEIRAVGGNKKNTMWITSSLQRGNIIYIQGFQKNVRKFKWLIAILLIPYFIIVCMISSFLAKRTNAPLQKIIENLGVTPSRGEDETEIVSRQIDRIKSENDMLNDVAARRYKLLRNRILNDILNGFQLAADQDLDNYDLNFLKKKCILILMECRSSDMLFSAKTPDEATNTTPYISQYLSKNMGDDETVIYTLHDKKILYLSANSERTVNDVLSVIEGARHEYSADITVVVGEWAAGVRALQDMYVSLETGLNNRQIAEGRDIITIEEIKSFRQSIGYYPLRLEIELSEFVKEGETAKALNRLERMFGYNNIVGNEDYNEFKTLISIAVKRIFNETEQAESEEFTRSDVFERISDAENMRTLYEAVSDAVSMISEYRGDLNRKNLDSLASRIMDYINSNICSDISINNVIDEFGISASYLTKLLKNSYNISFKKYINDAKISKAKEIMDNDKNVQIKDVAAWVGFNSSVSFIRAFKRIEGITPKQYLDM